MVPPQAAPQIDAAGGVDSPGTLERPEPPAQVSLRAVSRKRAAPTRRPRILMTTEGTYPYAVGGVSSWCDLVIGGLGEFDWQILPIMAGDRRNTAIFQLPPHARLVGQIELWSDGLPRRRWLASPDQRTGESLPANLVRALIGWE